MFYSLFILMKLDLADLILNEVKTARPIVLFKVFRHDKEIKRLLGIKKLRKKVFYDISDNKFIIKGKGDLVVIDEKSAKELIKRIKERIRYVKEVY